MSTPVTTLRAPEPETRHVHMEELDRLAAHELPRFYKQAYRQLGNAQDAEDAVQDALVSAYKNLSQFRGTAEFSTWLMTIVMNAARMQRRRRRPLVSFEEPIGLGDNDMTLLDTCKDNHPGPEEICEKTELHRLLTKSIDRLSPGSRRAIEFYYMEGMSITVAAQAIGVPEGTFKAQLARGRAKLAKLLSCKLNRSTATKGNKTRTTQHAT